MKKYLFILLITLNLLGQNNNTIILNEQSNLKPINLENILAKNQTKYRCDGRKYCSQMRSCKEAKFFINNCPNTRMDGDKDGIPCEKQWCHK